MEYISNKYALLSEGKSGLERDQSAPLIRNKENVAAFGR